MFPAIRPMQAGHASAPTSHSGTVIAVASIPTAPVTGRHRTNRLERTGVLGFCLVLVIFTSGVVAVPRPQRSDDGVPKCVLECLTLSFAQQRAASPPQRRGPSVSPSRFCLASLQVVPAPMPLSPSRFGSPPTGHPNKRLDPTRAGPFCLSLESLVSQRHLPRGSGAALCDTPVLLASTQPAPVRRLSRHGIPFRSSLWSLIRYKAPGRPGPDAHSSFLCRTTNQCSEWRDYAAFSFMSQRPAIADLCVRSHPLKQSAIPFYSDDLLVIEFSCRK